MTESLINTQTYENVVFNGFPVIPEEVSICYDDELRKTVVRFRVFSVSSRTISSVFIQVKAFDEENKLVSSVDGHELHVADAKYHAVFGTRFPLYIDSDKVKKVDFVISKVIFQNGEFWINEKKLKGETVDEAKPIDLPENLGEHLINKEAALLGIRTECQFEEHDTYWRCSCKTLNIPEYKSCCKCGASIEKLRSGFSCEYLMKKIEKQKESTYSTALMFYFGNDVASWKKAAVLFETLADYKDAKEYIAKCNEKIEYEENKAKKLEKQKLVKKLVKDFSIILAVVCVVVVGANIFFNNVIVPENKYKKAIELCEKKEYVKSYETFAELGKYKDSREKKNGMFSQYIQSKEKGDIIQFGNTEWILLDKKQNKVLVVARDVTDSKEFHNKYEDITWENCTMRSYLNNDFYNRFTKEEKAIIAETVISNPDNSNYGTKGGRDTKDKIFLLSLEEVKNFMSDDQRSASSWWWLRTPGQYSYDASVVTEKGMIQQSGNYVTYSYGSIRPAMWLSTE